MQCAKIYHPRKFALKKVIPHSLGERILPSVRSNGTGLHRRALMVKGDRTVEFGLAISYPGLRTNVARNWKLTERLYSRDGTSGTRARS